MSKVRLAVYERMAKQHVEPSEPPMAIYSDQFSSIVASQYIPQYVHDSVSNVSHLPGVNHWIKR